MTARITPVAAPVPVPVPVAVPVRVRSDLMVGLDLNAATADHKPDGEDELAEEGEGGDHDRVGGEHRAEGVEGVAGTGDHEQDTDQAGHVAGAVGQVAQ